MAVRIRMTRLGRKNRPYYRIVATDSHSPRDGSYIEALGHYDPIEKNEAKILELNEERLKYWLSVGAQPSEVVASILKQRKIQIPWVVRRIEKQKAGAGKKKTDAKASGKPRKVPSLAKKARAEANAAAARKKAETKKATTKVKKQIDKANKAK